MQYKEDGEVGGRRRTPRTTKHRKQVDEVEDIPHTMRDQLLFAVSDPEPELLQEFNMSPPDLNIVQAHGQGDPSQGSSRKNNTAVATSESPFGHVTRTSGEFVISTPLREDERVLFLQEARQQMASEQSRDKFVKVASVGSTILSFVALGLLLFGGFAAIKKSASGDE